MAEEHILFVDDEVAVLGGIERLLNKYHDRWEMTYIEQPAAAWKVLQRQKFDAVVTDLRMPGMNGLELLERIRNTDQTRGIPVVVLTGMSDCDLKRQAILLGAADLLRKPVDRDDLVARLENVLRQKSYVDGLQQINIALSEQVQQQNRQLTRSRFELVACLGRVAEQHDEEISNHVVRVALYSGIMAMALGLSRGIVELLLLAAPLHDIGKIGIPRAILSKPGPLSPSEWALMRRHCEIGEWILRGRSPQFDRLLSLSPQVAGLSSVDEPVLKAAAQIALCHHEKWDGSGYPLRLRGRKIPWEARIVAVADAFDALTSPRPYRDSCCEAEAVEILRTSTGSHFDPESYEAFEAALPSICSIRQRYTDGQYLPDDAEEILP